MCRARSQPSTFFCVPTTVGLRPPRIAAFQITSTVRSTPDTTRRRRRARTPGTPCSASEGNSSGGVASRSGCCVGTSEPVKRNGPCRTRSRFSRELLP